jgi:hypothetical protein
LTRIGKRRGSRRIGVPIFFVERHLGYSKDVRVRRRLLTRLRDATEKGWLEASDVSKQTVWTLTANGRRALARRQGSEAIVALPESPQHQAWREAHQVAGVQIAELRARFRDAFDQRSAVADSESTQSAVWLRMADACSRLGGATYCLFEWPEPDDAQADVAQRPDQRGLRDWRTWALPLRDA